MNKLKLQDLSLKGKKVLVRVDFNVPLNKDGTIADETRIKESIDTIQYLLNQGASVILISHLGRPKSKNDVHASLGICAKQLSKLLFVPVFFGADLFSKETEKLVKELKTGQILLLENLRFYPAEENPSLDPNFAKHLASFADFYVDDAFGSAHRNHSSITSITQFFPNKAAMGLLMQKELKNLNPLIESPERPFYTILGGAKMSTKLNLLNSLLPNIDAFFIGGAMAYTFLKAKGIEIGNSLIEETLIPKAEAFLNEAEKANKKIYLPLDVVISNNYSNTGSFKTVSIDQGIPQGWFGLDIGPQTIATWGQLLSNSKSCFWNGPLGVCEFSHFSIGTKKIAEILSTLKGKTVIGGGDSIAAINHLGLSKHFTHLSTGGGATLEYLELKTLPGIEALSDALT